MTTPANLHYINTADIDDLIDLIRAMKIRCIHATNGAYGAPQDIVKDTTLAGFQYVEDHVAGPSPQEAFMIAVNSDDSMVAAGKTGEEYQDTRALKVLKPLARQFPNRPVIGALYDEQTPTELYRLMPMLGSFNMASLHKWGGFGIGDNAPVIEGAEYFDHVLAFPFYNADKPAFWNDTRKGDQSDIVEVVDLHRTKLNNGKPYLDAKNKPLFDLK